MYKLCPKCGVSILREKFTLDRDASIDRSWLKCGLCNHHERKTDEVVERAVDVSELQEGSEPNGRRHEREES